MTTDFIGQLNWPSDFEITDPKHAYDAVNEDFPGTYECASDILKYCSHKCIFVVSLIRILR